MISEAAIACNGRQLRANTNANAIARIDDFPILHILRHTFFLYYACGKLIQQEVADALVALLLDP